MDDWTVDLMLGDCLEMMAEIEPRSVDLVLGVTIQEDEMTKKTCPLGEDCDLTVAWMAGRESAKDRIEALKAKLAKAVKALDEAWLMLTVPHLNYEPEPEEPGLRRIKTALAELKEDQ